MNRKQCQREADTYPTSEWQTITAWIVASSRSLAVSASWVAGSLGGWCCIYRPYRARYVLFWVPYLRPALDLSRAICTIEEKRYLQEALGIKESTRK